MVKCKASKEVFHKAAEPARRRLVPTGADGQPHSAEHWQRTAQVAELSLVVN